MIQQRAKPTRGQRAVMDDASLRAERLRTVLLAGLVAIYVARPLLPSEAPATVAGDGLPFVMLTLILAVTWALAQLVLPEVAVRFGLADWGWLGLLSWQAASTFLATRSGYARGAVNTFWEWTGLGIGFLLLRQLMRSGSERRAIGVVMIGLALTLSADGLYQFAIEHPATREMYRKDPEQVLRDLRLDAPPGSAGRMLFENRLRSNEPTATFALANSLAGFLVPWLLMTLAIGWLAGQAEAGAKTGNQAAWAAACALPMALCLVLTKSRAGYLAVAAGFAALLFVARRGRRSWHVAVGAAFGAIVLAVGFFAGALDLEVITESVKSLSYRWHYWQGALWMVHDHPLFGCGLGNFQDEYTQYKLPEASEVVADPHNLAFEVWAMCGTPALILLATILLAKTVESWRGGAKSTGDEARVILTTSAPRWRAPLAGGLVGLVLAFAVGLFSSVDLPARVFLSGLAILPVVTVIFMPWIRDGELPRQVPLVCAAALVVNLLAAGGIGFSGVAGSLWLLLAMSGAGEDRDQAHVSSRWGAGCAAAALVGLVGACYLTAYRPVLECRRLAALAELDPVHARESLLAATDADQLADEPWRLLATADFMQWRAEPSDELSDFWRQEQREVLRRRPHSNSIWLEAAERCFEAYRISSEAEHKQEFLNEALSLYRHAVELYPNFAIGHARLALALAAAGDKHANDEALLALELDRQTPHADLKLRKVLREEVQKVVRTSP